MILYSTFYFGSGQYTTLEYEKKNDFLWQMVYHLFFGSN
jgi:hypothetical protein